MELKIGSAKIRLEWVDEEKEQIKRILENPDSNLVKYRNDKKIIIEYLKEKDRWVEFDEIRENIGEQLESDIYDLGTFHEKSMLGMRKGQVRINGGKYSSHCKWEEKWTRVGLATIFYSLLGVMSVLLILNLVYF